MSKPDQNYCLDANVLIEAWQKYYSPKFCLDYWTLLNKLGSINRIFLPQLVFEEITRTEYELAIWLRESNIQVRKIDESVTKCLKQIYDADPVHQKLVDNIKQRSLADPWVIAHALNEGACVVTKEAKETAKNATRIKIPNVCDNMNIRCINDFQFVEELNIQFTCTLI